jgi:benzylsuccinate CoA-transferase BbsE subunit
MTEKALEGVRVIEFCDEVGSYCGKLLADLGAEVIKVEPPLGGLERHSPPYLHHEESPDTSLAFWVNNTSKKSVVLDLDTSEGQEAARKLVASAQIVLEDRPVGYLAERGLGFDAVHAANPALVYTSITGFGQTGPHAGYAFSDIVGQAMGGIMTLAGEQADPPNMIVGEQANRSASVHASQATLAALLHAEATGEGQYIDTSAQEACSMSQETAMQTWDLQKRNRVRTGALGAIPVKLPATGVYECRDGHVMLFVLAPAGKEFPALVDWMREKGMHEDLDEEPYASISNGLNMAMITQLMSNPASAGESLPHLAHINDVVTRFVASMGAVEAYEEGQRRNLLVGLVSTPEHLANNPQLRARDWYVKLPLDSGEVVEFPGPPYRLSESPAVPGTPPRLGQHTEEVLAALA